jgi:hypothetical protein
LRDSFKPTIRFAAVKLGLILEKYAENGLSELDVRNPLVVSISQRKLKLELILSRI